LIVDGRKRTFTKPEELKLFLAEKIEPNLTFVRSRSGQDTVDKEVRRVGRVFKGMLEDKKIKEPSVVSSLNATIRGAEAVIKRHHAPQQSSGKFKKIEKANQLLEEAKKSLKDNRIELKTVDEERANLEKKLDRNRITFETYSSENTKLVTRKNILEGDCSEMIKKLRTIVIIGFKGGK
jgi:hypothetical protein